MVSSGRAGCVEDLEFQDSIFTTHHLSVDRLAIEASKICDAAARAAEARGVEMPLNRSVSELMKQTWIERAKLIGSG